MKAEFLESVRGACLWLPETEEVVSHGAPNFRVRGRTFAMFLVNHHGDGRVALWLNAPPGAQEWYVRSAARQFFVPPYVGSRGWLGVQLDKGLSWRRIATLVREAYEHVAPATLSRGLEKTPAIRSPGRRLARGDIDPLASARGRAILRRLRRICLSFPETTEAVRFGSPVWQAGKRAFAMLRAADQSFQAHFWVGGPRQALLTADPRYAVPSYFGHRGWIALDVTHGADRDELAGLAEASFRHFALQRMLARLPET